MNALDIVFIVIIVISAIFSVIKGLIRELFFLAAVILGIVLAANYYLDVVEVLRPLLGAGTVAKVIGFALVFLIFAVGVSLVGVALSRIVRFAKLGWIDHLLGGFFGVIKGVLISAVICFVIVTFLPRGDELLEDSVMSPSLLIIIDQVTFLFPPELQEEFRERVEMLRELWKLRRMPGYERPPRQMHPDEVESGTVHHDRLARVSGSTGRSNSIPQWTRKLMV